MELIDNTGEVILLHHAVEHKSEECIQNLLAKMIDINKVDKNNRSALHIAIAKKRREIVELLVRNGANVNIKEKRLGMTALHLAIKQRDLLVARLLLQRGANPNEVTKHNSTALHIALEVQDEDLVKLSLDHGANIHAKKFGKSPLHLAAEYTNVGLAKHLLDRGSNVNDVCIDGQTALHIAVEMKDTEMVRLLLNNNARTDVKKFGKCPLYLAVKNDCIEIAKLLLASSSGNSEGYKNRCAALELAFKNKNANMVRAFLELGVDPKSKMSDKSALHLASECQWEETVRLLLEKGASASTATSDNVTSLHVALEKQHIGIVRLLLLAKAEVNARQCRSGVTALHIGVKKGCLETVRLLLEAGAQPNIPTNLNITALHLAFEARDRPMIGLLLRYGADPNLPKYGKSPLELAIECRWSDLARRLLELGADPNSLGSDHQSMLFSAIKQKNVELIGLLVEFRADPNAADPRSQMSPLQMAASCRCDEAAELLVSVGARLDYATEDGTTALHLALERRRERLVKLLLERGASLSIKRRSLAPLHVAVESRWLEVAEMLLLRGANVNEQTVYLATPLFYAVEKNEPRIAKMLLAHGAEVNYKWYGSTALHQAASLRQAEMVELLLDSGARVNDFNDQDQDCVSALHIALKNADERVARILLERRASVKMRDRKMGRTALHLAAESGCLEATKIILQRGAHVNEEDRLGVTALQLAVMRGRARMAELLLESGARVNARNRADHYTCLHYAVLNLNYGLARLLLAEGAEPHCDHPDVKTPFGLALHKLEDERMLQLLLLERDPGPLVHRQMLQQAARLPQGQASPVGETLLRHLVRRRADLGPALLDAHNIGEPLRGYAASCEAEARRMRREVFYENASLFAVLSKPARDLSALARNQSLFEAFEACGYRAKYPIYERTLGDSMRAARDMSRLLDGAETTLGRLFRCVLPHLLNHMILAQLSNTDLRILNSMNAHSPPPEQPAA